jgi:peptide deformylase
MALLTVITHPNPILRQPTVPVTHFGSTLHRLTKDMFATMKSQRGVGLAAPQVSVLDKLIVARYNEHEFQLVNPEVVLGEGSAVDDEGCLSIPDVVVPVERWEHIVVDAQDPNGEALRLELSGYVARIIQHEIDHLNGVLIIDKPYNDTLGPTLKPYIKEELDVD